jgi:hypothetical protein
MALGGEINGTTCLLYKGVAGTEELIGQMEMSITYGGTPIDISNKSAGDWICLLDGELAAKQIVIAGTVVYNSDATYEAVKAEAFVGTQDDYTFKFGSSAEALAGKFVPTGMSDATPQGDKVSTAISFNSSGEVTRTPQVPAV